MWKKVFIKSSFFFIPRHSLAKMDIFQLSSANIWDLVHLQHDFNHPLTRLAVFICAAAA